MKLKVKQLHISCNINKLEYKYCFFKRLCNTKPKL